MTDDKASGAPATRTENGAITEYRGGVRAELADLPPAEVADILDDLGAHLADLEAEHGPDAEFSALVARLGPPAAYAAELRSAAGYPPPPLPGRSSAAARLAVVGLVGSTLVVAFGMLGGPNDAIPAMFVAVIVALLAVPLLTNDGPRVPSVAALPSVRRFLAMRPRPGSAGARITDYLAGLQPAWWLARALVASSLVALLLGGRGIEWVVLVALVAVPLSVLTGHWSRKDRRALWLVVPLNAVAVALAVMYVLWAPPLSVNGGVDYTPSPLPDGVMWNGHVVRDIRPVDATGTPLTSVYLFDQDGQPVDVGGTCDEWAAGPLERPDRPYPRGTWDYDERGRCVNTPPGPLVVAIPQTSAVVTTTPVPPPLTSAATPTSPQPTPSG